MNKLIKFFTIFVCFNLFGVDSDQENFIKANNLFKKKSFTEALEIYKLIENKGFQEWFNIGTTYYEDRKFAYAIGAWKKAEKFGSFKQKSIVELYIKKAKEKLSKVDNQNLVNKFYIFFIKILSLIPLIYLQILLLVLWYLLMIFFEKLLKSKRYFFLFFLLLFNVIIINCIVIKNSEKNKKMGIIVEENAKVFAGPDKIYHSIGQLGLGDEVKINEQNNKWVKISNSDFKGWMQISSMFIV